MAAGSSTRSLRRRLSVRRLLAGLVLALAVLAAPAHAAVKYLGPPVLDQAGNALFNATVTVYLAGTTTLATIYSDNGVTPITNPLTTTVTGSYVFYAAAGQCYDLVIAKPGFLFTAADTSHICLSTTLAWANVKEYGAVGDGVADDTAAWTTAIQTAAHGSVLYVPPGSYKVTTLPAITNALRTHDETGIVLANAAFGDASYLLSTNLLGAVL